MTPAEFTAIREAANLSKAALARQLGVTRMQVFRYETGKTPIPPLVERYMKELEGEADDHP